MKVRCTLWLYNHYLQEKWIGTFCRHVIHVLLKSQSPPQRSRGVVPKVPLQIHRKGAPDNFLCVRGTPTGRMDDGHHDRRVGRDKRPASIRARSRRDARPPGEPRRGEKRRSGDLAHLVLGGFPLCYVVSPDASTPPSSALVLLLSLLLLFMPMPMPMPMGARASPSKPTRLLPLLARSLAIALAIAPRARDAAEGAHMVREARPVAEGRDEEEGGEDDVVEQDGRDGARLVLVVVRRDGRAVDRELEACRQRVRAELGQQGSDTRRA